MENNVDDEPSKPPYKYLPLNLLKDMTNNFSEELLISRGRYGDVYKGVSADGCTIAVKKLLVVPGIYNELNLGTEIFHHKNIVELVGYCNEEEEVVIKLDGKHVFALDIHRAICFEYLPNESLDWYITDISSGLNWRTRYRIIKNICDGLRYLHEGSKDPILHLNLKLSNILLDRDMTAKIGDFGMPRLTGEEYTPDSTETYEHLPPEFVEKQVFSKEFDIYSLGVIITKLMTGDELYSKLGNISLEEFIELANENWRKRLESTEDYISVGGYCEQVNICLEIALKCLASDRRRRPAIGDIVYMLNETETVILQLEFFSNTVLLDSEDSRRFLHVHPPELRFLPAMSSSQVPRKKVAMLSSCSVQLHNKGDDRVAFMLVAQNPKRYLTKKPLCGVLPPRSAYTLTLTMLKQRPHSADVDPEEFFTLYSVLVGEYDLLDFDKDSMSIEYSNFFKKAIEMAGGDGEEVQEVRLKVICDQPAADQRTTSPASEVNTLYSATVGEHGLVDVDNFFNKVKEGKKAVVQTTLDAQQISSMDVHPTKPWIVTTNYVGCLRVWNHDTMATVDTLELDMYEPVRAARFIIRGKWILAGDQNGCIHVHNYDKNQHVTSFDAHDSDITILAVNPSYPIVLSSCSYNDDHLIKLWDWKKNWRCTRTFRGHTDRVTQVKFNPEDNNIFASSSWDGTVKIWSIFSENPNNIITLNLEERPLCIDYFTRNSRQHLIVGCKDRRAQIWEPNKIRCIDMLEGHADYITAVSLHPCHPFLITGSLDGFIRIWNSTTYKLENIFGFNLGAVYAFGCIKGSKRIVVGCHQGIARMEMP